MGFYKKIGVRTLINASETYTNLGGSLMDKRTLQAMQEAANDFVDMSELMQRSREEAARLTGNEDAFITTGAAGGVILAAAACMYMKNKDFEQENNELLLDKFPQIDSFPNNEILIYEGDFINIIPYWRLIKLTGAKIKFIKPNLEELENNIDEKTVGFFLFPASLYEHGIPSCKETIPVLKKLGVYSVVDAAAQLPPKSNLSYYSRQLGADLVIFSGGKHIRGPQSTGLMVGKKDLIEICSKLASPNPRIGRAFKTGKEEIAGFLTALSIFMEEDTEERYKQQEEILQRIKVELEQLEELEIDMQYEGRLGTYQPLLNIKFLPGWEGKECNKFAWTYKTPIDIGVYSPEFKKEPNCIFINAYNLKDAEHLDVIEVVKAFVEAKRDNML